MPLCGSFPSRFTLSHRAMQSRRRHPRSRPRQLLNCGDYHGRYLTNTFYDFRQAVVAVEQRPLIE